jgi:hypothetical protein
MGLLEVGNLCAYMKERGLGGFQTVTITKETAAPSVGSRKHSGSYRMYTRGRSLM